MKKKPAKAKTKKSNSAINKLCEAILKTAHNLEDLLIKYEKAKDKKPRKTTSKPKTKKRIS